LSLQGQIKALQTRRTLLEKELKGKRAKIRKVTADKDKSLPQLIEDANDQLLEERRYAHSLVRTLLTDIDSRIQTMAKSAEIYFKNFIKTGEADKCCPLCYRKFAKDVDLRAFLG
jgi:hypothetical protein